MLKTQNSNDSKFSSTELFQSPKSSSYYTHSKPDESYSSYIPVLLQQCYSCDHKGWCGKRIAGHLLFPRILKVYNSGRKNWEQPAWIKYENMPWCFFLNFYLIRSTFISQKGGLVYRITNNHYFWIKNIWNYIKIKWFWKMTFCTPKCPVFH